MQEIVKSSVVYTLALEDVIASNLFYFRNSSTIRNMQRRSLIMASLTAFFCGLGVPLLTGLMPFWPSLVVAIACTAYTAGYYRYYHKRGYIKRVRKMVKKMIAENKSPGLLGEHTLEVDEEGIIHINAFTRSHYTWGALNKIETEPGYTYISLGTQTFIIRHEGIVSGNFKGFLERIGQHHQPGQMIAR